MRRKTQLVPVIVLVERQKRKVLINLSFEKGFLSDLESEYYCSFYFFSALCYGSWGFAVINIDKPGEFVVACNSSIHWCSYFRA